MKNWVKKLLKWGALLFLVGALIAAIGLATSGFSFADMSGATYETHSVSISDGDTIKSITVDLDTTDLIVEYSTEAEKLAVTYETKSTRNGKSLITVKDSISNGNLVLTEQRSWMAQFSLFDFYNMKVTVTVPVGQALAFDIETDTGDVKINGAKAISVLKIETNTGDVTVKESEIASLEVDVDTGNALLKDLIISEGVTAESDTGDLTFENLSAPSAKITADTGSVELAGVTAQTTLKIETDTGDVELKSSVKAETVTINTDTGDVDGEYGLLDATSVNIKTDTGDVELYLAGANSDYGIILNLSTGDANVKNQHGGTRSLNFTSSTGDGEFYFEN